MAAVGFEPTPPRRLVPKTSALDHSAMLPMLDIRNISLLVTLKAVSLDFYPNRPDEANFQSS